MGWVGDRASYYWGPRGKFYCVYSAGICKKLEGRQRRQVNLQQSCYVDESGGSLLSIKLGCREPNESTEEEWNLQQSWCFDESCGSS